MHAPGSTGVRRHAGAHKQGRGRVGGRAGAGGQGSASGDWSWCCLYFLLGLFVFSLISRRFVFPISNVFVCNFPEVVCNLNRDSRIGTLKYEKEKNAPRRRQRSKMFVYQNEEKNAREADGALCRPRRTRPRPGRIAELVVNMYYV